MSDCCQTQSRCNKNKKRNCPSCGKPQGQVAVKTILQHLQEPWQWQPADQQHYFCKNPQCSVIYFDNQDETIEQSALRTTVGIKSQSSDALLCYCYNVTRADFAENPKIKDFVIAQTKAKQCACDISNPSGKCCLRDFEAVKVF